jgi:uncharacterized membrane protein (UPF0127 family)
MAQRLLAFAFLAALMAACSAEVEPLPTLDGVSSTTISIDDRVLVVAVADTPETRRRGLMNVTDLGALDGMLFVWEADTAAAFWMKNTLIPLDIAFFSVDGSFVDRLTMEPCTADSCPLHSASGLYRYALEAPAGDLEFTSPGSKLVIESGS